ncbi:Replication termination factor 2, partial [Durusdinium trenchii]
RHRVRMSTCMLSQEALREPVVACRLGNLYNKEAVISALLNRKMPSDLSHIRGLKDVKQCLITWKEDEKEDGRKRIVCPLSREDLDTGSARAVVIWPSGAVVSAKSLKEMKMKECPVTSKAFDNEKDVIPLAPDGEELQRLRERLPTKKRKAQAAAPEAEEEDLEAESKEKKAKPEKDSSKDSEVYKNLFTKDREGLGGVRDAFGTPIYNRGARCI